MHDKNKNLKEMIGKPLVTKGVEMDSRETDTNPGLRRDWCLRDGSYTVISMHLVFMS